MSLVQISYHLAIDPETVCAIEAKKALAPTINAPSYLTAVEVVEITTTHGTYQTTATYEEVLAALNESSKGDPE